MPDEQLYPARPLALGVAEYFRHHCDAAGRCVACTWSFSDRTRLFSLGAISRVCPVHGQLARSARRPGSGPAPRPACR